MSDPLATYQQFVARIDAHARRVSEAHTAEIACEAGCSGCCHRDLTVFPVEAAAIAAWIAEQQPDLSPREAPTVSPQALQLLELGKAEPCVMLDRQGLCRIYPVRPLICRTHGLPLAIPDEHGVYGDVCPLSFDGGTALAELPSEDFLSLETINTVLAALNAQFTEATEAPQRRIALRELSSQA